MSKDNMKAHKPNLYEECNVLYKGRWRKGVYLGTAKRGHIRNFRLRDGKIVWIGPEAVAKAVLAKARGES